LAALLSSSALAVTLTGEHMYTINYDWANLQFSLNDTVSMPTDTVWTTLVADTYHIQMSFFQFVLPGTPANCDSFSVEVWTSNLSELEPTGVLIQVFVLEAGDSFSYPETEFWGQWGVYHTCPDSSQLCLNRSPVAADARNAYLLNRDRPNAVRFVIGVRTYVNHIHQIDHVALNWYGITNAVNPPSAVLPASVSLSNYPNPFNPSTNIAYNLQKTTVVSLKVYNVLGQEIRVLLQQTMMPAGSHTVSWDGTNSNGLPVPSGSYWIRLQSDYGIKVQRALLVR